MRITITEKEYDAISFALGRVQTEIEDASEEEWVDMACEATGALHNVQEKYRKARMKANYFQSVRAEVSRHNRNRGLRARDIDRLTRQVIKKIKED